MIIHTDRIRTVCAEGYNLALFNGGYRKILSFGYRCRVGQEETIVINLAPPHRSAREHLHHQMALRRCCSALRLARDQEAFWRELIRQKGPSPFRLRSQAQYAQVIGSCKRRLRRFIAEAETFLHT